MEHKCDEWIGIWIKKVSRNIHNYHDKQLSKHGLTTSQVVVLAQLWENDGLTQKEIQEKLEIKPASISGIVDLLVSKGWIIRKTDEKDGRVKRLYITEKSKNIQSECLEILLKVEEKLTKGFTEEEKVIFLSWIKRMHANMQ